MAGAAKARGGRGEVGAVSSRGAAARSGDVAAHLVVRRIPGRQPHHHVGQVGALRLVLLGQLDLAGARRGDRRRHREGDAAAGTGLERPAHRLGRVLHHVQRRLCVVGVQRDARAVDAVEQVKADVGLARQVERLVDQRARLVALALVQRDLGQPLQRQRLADRAADRAVQPCAFAQVLARAAPGRRPATRPRRASVVPKAWPRAAPSRCASVASASAKAITSGIRLARRTGSAA